MCKQSLVQIQQNLESRGIFFNKKVAENMI